MVCKRILPKTNKPSPKPCGIPATWCSCKASCEKNLPKVLPNHSRGYEGIIVDDRCCCILDHFLHMWPTRYFVLNESLALFYFKDETEYLDGKLPLAAIPLSMVEQVSCHGDKPRQYVLSLCVCVCVCVFWEDTHTHHTHTHRHTRRPKHEYHLSCALLAG